MSAEDMRPMPKRDGKGEAAEVDRASRTKQTNINDEGWQGRKRRPPTEVEQTKAQQQAPAGGAFLDSTNKCNDGGRHRCR